MSDTGKILAILEKAAGRKLRKVELPEVMKWENQGSYAEDNAGNIAGLNLWGCGIKDLSFLKHVPNLRQMDLSENEISDYSFLQHVPNLTQLYLSSNQISDLSFLRYVPKLKQLDLRSNQISDLSFLKYVPNLTELDLRTNPIRDLSSLQHVPDLRQLYLNENNIVDLTFLQYVPNLRGLDLMRNKISDISFLRYVPNLTQLDLMQNRISDLSFLRHVPKLTELNLGSNGIGDLSFLAHVPNLTRLELGGNRIRDFSYLWYAPNLRQLDLSYNQISDILPILNLRSLNSLDLRKNKITRVPEQIMDLGIDVTWAEYGGRGINLFDNPIERPPLEIVKKGREAILAYFKSLEGDRMPLNEVKVLLVGDGGAGKTSLMKRLTGKEFDENEEQTHGININDLSFSVNGLKITAHCWDFGGQIVMHATHQFFFSRRSLYVLVLDGRKEEDAEYWLQLIQSFGGNSPVIVVLNKMDKNPGYDVDRKLLKEKYPGIRSFIPLSCATGEGVDDFMSGVKKEMARAELLRETWGRSWLNIKQRLEKMREKNEDFISYDTYKNMCDNENIPDGVTQNTLVSYLSDLGTVVHFEDLNLLDTYVLEPRWVTEAVYKIINSKELANGKGILPLTCLAGILEKHGDGDYYYPPNRFEFVVNLMLKFELCYKIADHSILVPNLLQVGRPDFSFEENESLKFLLEYNYLPKSIMPRFIVRMHKDIKGELRWRTGVVLEDKSFRCAAVVKADEKEKKIYIYVAGEQKRDYFATIRKTINDINGSFEKLPVRQLVPLPDNDEITIEYEELIGYERAGKDEIFIGKLGKSYSVSKLLNGIEKLENRNTPPDGPYFQNIINIPEQKPPEVAPKKSLPKIVWIIIAGAATIAALLAHSLAGC